MSTMRQLANLYFEMKKICNERELEFIDIFDSVLFFEIEEAIDRLTITEEKIKHGLRVTLGFTLKKASKFYTNYFSIKEETGLERRLEKFCRKLEFHWEEVFLDSEEANKRRAFELRSHKQLPRKESLKKLRNYTLINIKKIMKSKNICTKKYVELRRLVCARLTLFNGSRGGEASRLDCESAEKALENSHVDESVIGELTSNEKQTLAAYKVAYQRSY